MANTPTSSVATPATPVAQVQGSMPAPKPVAPPPGVKPAVNPAASGPKAVGATSAGGLKMASAAGTATPIKPPFTIQNLGERNKYLKALFYGEYGSGKTWLAGTAADVPELNDVILISAESGELTLFDPEHNFDKIDVVWAQTYATIARVYEFLRLHCQARDAGDIDKLRQLEAKLKDVLPEEIETPRQYRTVLLDSLTEIETYCMNQLLGIKDSTRLDEEVASAEWAEYKKNHTMVQRLVRNFRDLPMHVIFTCARTFVQDEQKRFNYMPYLTGKLGAQVQGFMDVVGYLTMLPVDEKGQLPRRLMVQPVGKFAAKCRFSTYKKAYFDNPTMGSILKDVGLTQSKPK